MKRLRRFAYPSGAEISPYLDMDLGRRRIEAVRGREEDENNIAATRSTRVGETIMEINGINYTVSVRKAGRKGDPFHTLENSCAASGDVRDFTASPKAGKNNGMASLEIEGSAQPLSLVEKAEYTLGRVDPATHSYPDIDLTPYGALDAGVSRRHAKITRLGGGRYYIMDLASTNYTHVNGERLEAFEPRPLSDGDEIYMGTLKMFFRA